MIASLPVTAWLLLGATIVLPLAIEFAYYFTHRTARRRQRQGEESRIDGDVGG